jgi:hypothetical protein
VWWEWEQREARETVALLKTLPDGVCFDLLQVMME